MPVHMGSHIAHSSPYILPTLCVVAETPRTQNSGHNANESAFDQARPARMPASCDAQLDQASWTTDRFLVDRLTPRSFHP